MLCNHCGNAGVIYRQINGNGNIVIVERCPVCRTNTRPKTPFLPKKDFENIDDLPLWEDYQVDSEPCSVRGCDRTDTEWHHFAPRHLFGHECEDWPGAWLCMHHHKMWHKLTQTGSYITQKKTPQRAKAVTT